MYLNELKRLAKEDDVIIDVIARRRFGKEPVEEVAVPGVIKVYQDSFIWKISGIYVLRLP